MSFETKQIFEFGRFRLDVEEHTLELTDGTKNGTLPDKTFQALVLLVSRPGHLVTKEDLLNGIWPDTAVEENNLDKRIHHLRKYLGEKPGGGSYIETVRGRGYRFVGNVRAAEVSGSWLPETYRAFKGEDQPNGGNGSAALHIPLPPGNAGSHETIPRDRHTSSSPFIRFRTVIVGAVLILMSASAIGYFGFVRGTGTKIKKSVAVLPVLPIDISNRSDRYELGIADAVINRVSSIEGFLARPLSSTRQYTDLSRDPIAAGREQKTDFVIASNYQLDRGEIRVTWQLINVADESIEATHTFEYDASSAFAVEDALAADIGSKLMTKFGATMSGQLRRRGTDNEEAYRLFLQGSYLSDKMGRENQLKAVESLERAVSLDSKYAEAWAGKALAHRGLAVTKDADSEEQYKRSMEAANTALALDPNLSEGYSAICLNKLHYEFDLPGAERACRKAVELDPSSPIGHSTYAMVLNCRGRAKEALVQIQIAIELEPASYFNRRIYGNSLYFARRYDEAAAHFKRVIDLDPTASTYANLIWALAAQGKYDEAFDYLQKSMIVEKTDAAVIERVQAAYHTSGWPGVLQERLTSVSLRDTNNFRLAGWCAQLGDKDRAFEFLEKAYQEHFWAIATLEVEPQFDPVRSDPRYADLIKRIQENSSGN